jgi:3-hydroxyisobutyrate dehydrogenase-like beta-hydroxyacid dehydrogenase
MKLCNNFLSATSMTATAEAMVLGVKAGLDPRVMLDVINASSGRNTATETKFPRNVLPGTFDLGFTNGLMAKDVGLAVSQARTFGVPMEIAELVLQHLRRACEEIGANADLSTVVQPLERRAGIEVRAKK